MKRKLKQYWMSGSSLHQWALQPQLPPLLIAGLSACAHGQLCYSVTADQDAGKRGFGEAVPEALPPCAQELHASRAWCWVPVCQRQLEGAARGGCSARDYKPGTKGDGRAVPSMGLVPALPSNLLCSCMAVQPPSCPPAQAATPPLTEMLVLSSTPQILELRVKRMQNHSIFTCKVKYISYAKTLV